MTYFKRLTFHPTHPSSDNGPREYRFSAENLQDAQTKATRGHGSTAQKVELFDGESRHLGCARYVEITPNGLRAWRWGIAP